MFIYWSFLFYLLSFSLMYSWIVWSLRISWTFDFSYAILARSERKLRDHTPGWKFPNPPTQLIWVGWRRNPLLWRSWDGSVYVLSFLISYLWLTHSLDRLACEPCWFDDLLLFWFVDSLISQADQLSTDKRLGHVLSILCCAVLDLTCLLPPCLEQMFIDKKEEARAERLLWHVFHCDR